MKNSAFLLVTLLFAMLFSSCSFNLGTNLNVNTANANANSNANDTIEPTGTPASGGDASTAAAEALVADLYKAHDGKRSPFFQTKDRGLVDKYFTKQLADLIWKDAVSSQGEVGAISADPLYNAEDIEIKNFAVGKGEFFLKTDTMEVPVTFTNFGKKEKLIFMFARSGSNWKIDDIIYGGGSTLMKWLKEAGPANETTRSSGEFEGRYSVGNTTCSVKPIKMAFEVKWARGKGSETFFFKEGNTFESEPEGNRFVFDDGNYNSGTFVRADGKNMPVRRG